MNKLTDNETTFAEKAFKPFFVRWLKSNRYFKIYSIAWMNTRHFKLREATFENIIHKFIHKSLSDYYLGDIINQTIDFSESDNLLPIGGWWEINSKFSNFFHTYFWAEYQNKKR